MKSPFFLLRVIGLPLFSLALALTLVGRQYARCNRFARELKEAQAEYARLSRSLPSVPAAASAMFSGSYPHTHPDSEEEAPHTDTATPAPPTRQTAEEERNLFLTPGGVYTQDDIAANGNRVPSQMFAGLLAKHNMHPKAGERICPITNTQADPQFAWIVGGKTYTFCCPPCVTEFVQKAKKQTKPLPPPESYKQH